MKTRKDSISFIFSKHQILMFSIIIVFFICNSMVLFYNERNSVAGERQFQLNAASEKVLNRMNSYEKDILDTLTTMQDSYTGLWSDEQGKKVFDKQKLNTFIRNKRTSTGAPLFYFAAQKNGFTVFQGGENEPIESRLAVKDYVEEHLEEIATSTREKMWKFVDINGEIYCFYCYFVSEDIYVGMAVKPTALFDEIVCLARDYYGAFAIYRNDDICYEYGIVSKHDSPGNKVFTDVNIGFGFSANVSFKISALNFFKNNIIVFLVLALSLCVIMVLYTNKMLKSKIIMPVKSVADAVNAIEEITDETAIPADNDIYEIRNLSKRINILLKDVVYSRMEAYSAEIYKKEQELVNLRSQIRPHFFLNAITTVNAMTYQDRNEDIRSYLMKLSEFMRYIMANSEESVTIEEEMNNVKNYCEMQEIRFPGKAMLFADVSPEIMNVYMPKCLILTLAENAYKYAMSERDVMQLYIECKPITEDGFKGVLITIEDNGTGFDEDELLYYNQNKLKPNTKGSHLGLTNVKETLELYYKMHNLMRIDNAVPTGAHIEIRIPA